MTDENCPFCKFQDKAVLENDLAFSLYDISPASEGHMLVMPKRHFADIFECTPEETQAVYDLLKECKAHLIKEHNPDAFNLMANNGEVAGQTVWHAHLHLVPRYQGQSLKSGIVAK